jgi:hypothetical protein
MSQSDIAHRPNHTYTIMVGDTKVTFGFPGDYDPRTPKGPDWDEETGLCWDMEEQT